MEHIGTIIAHRNDNSLGQAVDEFFVNLKRLTVVRCNDCKNPLEVAVNMRDREVYSLCRQCNVGAGLGVVIHQANGQIVVSQKK